MDSFDYLAIAVKDAANRRAVCEAVDGLYAELEGEIALRKPVCVMSGHCCRFEEYGHRLYVTTMELAAFVRRYQSIAVAAKPVDGGCAFQRSRMCWVHAFRPMGCRLFFCDAAAGAWQQEKYEEFHSRLKRMHETMEVPYAYVEWRAGLEMVGLTQ
jgi:Fe-S-cluster containining protein